MGPNSARTCYDSLACNGEGNNRIAEIFENEYDGIMYEAGLYTLTKYDEASGKAVNTGIIVAYGFSLNSAEHYKSGSWPSVGLVLFDEFIAMKGVYLVDEFVIFMNMLSTIIRQRDDVDIWMCGNTISKHCPYFREMGLNHILESKPGDIDVYEYSNGLRVVTCYSDTASKKRKSDIYFAFDNPKLRMITDGSWQLDIYPHAPCKWVPKDEVFRFFIRFEDALFQADVVNKDGNPFLFIHEKTGEIKDPENDFVYQQEWSCRTNVRRNILRPTLPVEKRIAMLFRQDKVFYQDNTVGDMIHGYLEWCKTA